MTKEELISLYPQSFNLELVIAIGMVLLMGGLVFGRLGSTINKDWLTFSSLVVTTVGIIGLMIYSVYSSTQIIEKKEKWNKEYYSQYLDTLIPENYEVSELIEKQDQGYVVKIVRDGVSVEVPVDEVEFVHNSKESKMTGKFVEGLDEYGVPTGYKDVKVVYPAE